MTTNSETKAVVVGPILMIGALTMTYVRDSWVRPAQAELGATCVDVAKLLVAEGVQWTERYLYSVLQEGRFEYLFFYSDSLHQELSEEFFANVRRAGITIVAYHADDEPEFWYRANEPFDHRYDLVASHSKRGAERRARKGATRSLHLPWGYNPEYFYPLPREEQQYDVVFVGTNNDYAGRTGGDGVDRGISGDGRQDILVELYRYCVAEGLHMQVFGMGWDRHPILKSCNGGWLSHGQMVEVYSRAKVVFNPGFNAEEGSRDYQTKLRHYEVPGCAALQVVNWNPDLAEQFRDGEEIVFYRTPEELFAKVSHYVHHPEERQRLAEAGYRRALQDHTTGARLRQLFENAAGLRFAAGRATTIGSDAAQARIETVTVRDRVEARRWLAEGAVDPQADFVHFVAGDFAVVELAYSTLQPVLTRVDADLFGCRCFFETGFTHENTLQRKPRYFEGVVLPAVIRCGLDVHARCAVDERLLCLEDEGLSWPLVNLVVKAGLARRLLELFLQGDVAAFRSLRLYPTGRVVSDLREDEQPRHLEPAYLARLPRLLEKLAAGGQRVVIYGARGEMAAHVFNALEIYRGVNLVGAVDRSIAGQKVRGVRVYGYEDLEELRPQAIIIAAAQAGPAIFERVRHLQATAAVFPLYDLADPVWQVWL